MPDVGCCFLAGQEAIWCGFARRRHVAELTEVIVERHLICTSPSPPPALPVARLIDDDAIDPGPQCRLSPEAREGAEHSQEYLLRQVERVVAVAEQVNGQTVDHPLMSGNEFCASVFVASGTATDEGGFLAIDVCPADC